MKARFLPARRWYSLRRTSSSASPRWRMMWNLSKTTRAFGAFFVSELRKGFHMSIAASSMAALFFAPSKVAHHHAVVVALADGDLIDADGPRRGEPGLRDLLLHVDRVEILHRAVVKALQLGHRLVRHLVAERTHVHGEALGVARVLRQPVEPLYVHTAAPRAGDPPALELEVDPPAGHREVARSEEHTSELQSRLHLVCRLLLEKKKT